MIRREICSASCRNIEASAGPLQGHSGSIVNAMSVDVEDYFQVSAFAHRVRFRDWRSFEGRVERNTDAVLQLFSDYGVKATFFTLGWVAEHHPRLIRRIVAGGHELASHGFAHVRVCEQIPSEFRKDVRRTKRLLEDVGGCAVHGYRAASFSINKATLWAFDVLAEENYSYSSSIYPIRHDHYGMVDAPRFAFRPQGRDGILELPLTTVSVLGQKLPCAGGGYFRLVPYCFSRSAMRRVNGRDHQPCIFFFHPWEIDPNQPRFGSIPLTSRFRHYFNLTKMEERLRAVLNDFLWNRIDRIFLHDQGPSPA